MAKRLRCYLGFHHFVRLKTEDGEWYKKCRDCGKFRDMPSTPIIPGGM